MVDDFHDRGVKVLFPYNPWDQGTRDEGTSDQYAIAQLWSGMNCDDLYSLVQRLERMDSMEIPCTVSQSHFMMHQLKLDIH